MEPATVAHTLVAARADRVSELARLYRLLERAVVGGGADGDGARRAHRALGARIVEWNGIDMEVERRDVVTIDAAEREEMLHTLRGAFALSEGYLETPIPTSMPRADLVRFRRSAARFQSLQGLGAPALIAGNEARLMRAALESSTAAIPPPDPDFDPGSDFRATFAWGLEACVICEPGAAGGADLGLGTSRAVAALLAVTGEDRYPYVPRGRFCTISAMGPLRGDLESTGPIGWAAGGDVAILARDLAGVADQQPAFAAELCAVSERVESAARQGHAVIGLIEPLPPETDGERTHLVHL
jgi:hypothetical protein